LSIQKKLLITSHYGLFLLFSCFNCKHTELHTTGALPIKFMVVVVVVVVQQANSIGRFHKYNVIYIRRFIASFLVQGLNEYLSKVRVYSIKAEKECWSTYCNDLYGLLSQFFHSL